MGKSYKLKQFPLSHWFPEAENIISIGRIKVSLLRKAHFVHVSDDGKIAVIGVMFEEGKENPILKRICNHLSHLDKGTKREMWIECRRY